MSTMAEIFRYVVQALGGLFLFAVVLRLLLQLARADFYNPLSQFVVKVTNPLLLPLRRVIPPVGRVDSASLVLALAVQSLIILLVLALYGYGPGNVFLILAWSAIAIAALVVQVYFYGIIVLIILSWIAPHAHHPAVALLHQLMEPAMAPFRRLLPPVGGIDLSPILIFLVLQVVRIALQGMARGLHLPSGLVPGL